MQKTTAKKLAIVAAVALVAGAYFFFDLNQYLSLDVLKDQQRRLQELYHQHTISVLAAYFALYVLVVSLNLPGAVPMSLAGGAVFGFWPALVAVSFASTLGATLACALSRYLLADWVQNHFGDKLRRIHQGVEREGAFYLFTMRLIPAFPFFAINLVMGLTRMKLWTFYWVSQLGMLPGTAVFINAGKELGEIKSASGILSPELLLSFALIGVFPLAAKKTVGLIRKHKTPETPK